MNQTQNDKGQWVPAIPEPYENTWTWRCGCGETFLKKSNYKGHYALKHILFL